MPWEIVKQPRKQGQREDLYARFSTVTMSNTHQDLPRAEMIITLVRKNYCSVEQARRLVQEAQPAKSGKPYPYYHSGNL